MQAITDFKELMALELDILQDVHNFCVANDITYCLFYGTLLGAVRHNGFIPWDDDIDIAMPRADYERFMSTYRSDRYVAYCCENNRDYPYPFGKVIDTQTVKQEPIVCPLTLGVDIDIFPLDNEDECLLTVRQLQRRKALVRQHFCAIRQYYPLSSPKNLLKNIYLFVHKATGKNAHVYAEQLNASASAKPDTGGEYLCYCDHSEAPLSRQTGFLRSFDPSSV